VPKLKSNDIVEEYCVECRSRIIGKAHHTQMGMICYRCLDDESDRASSLIGFVLIGISAFVMGVFVAWSVCN